MTRLRTELERAAQHQALQVHAAGPLLTKLIFYFIWLSVNVGVPVATMITPAVHIRRACVQRAWPRAARGAAGMPGIDVVVPVETRPPKGYACSGTLPLDLAQPRRLPARAPGCSGSSECNAAASTLRGGADDWLMYESIRMQGAVWLRSRAQARLHAWRHWMLPHGAPWSRPQGPGRPSCSASG